MLATAVVILDQELRVVHINQPAEVLFGASSRLLEGSYLLEVLDVAEEVEEMLSQASSQMFESKRLQCDWQLPMRGSVELDSTVSVHLEEEGVVLSLELREIAQQRKADREVHQADLTHANKELLRNLAHEIKNPLGGVRGAAQLLDRELPSEELREYTQVIIKEADRLQGLVDQMLAPHRRLRVMESVNIHEVCERVRSLMLAEFPKGLAIKRDYDISIPDLRGDREQLIQVVLNVVRNAAEALAGEGEIVLCSRIARQVTISKKRCRLALDLHVIDNGPGIPEELRERVFYPLVSGRPQGHGLGLTLAQSYVHQHGGLIDVESRPGRTDFLIRIPIA
ncbi:MAG: PAS domain-containing sensor histidine kinase, partial [Betaproteobacteria bacterium]|nr:PAS domain-containing sensor histidine kinase [Betaproteobacteria bacterium]